VFHISQEHRSTHVPVITSRLPRGSRLALPLRSPSFHGSGVPLPNACLRGRAELDWNLLETKARSHITISVTSTPREPKACRVPLQAAGAPGHLGPRHGATRPHAGVTLRTRRLGSCAARQKERTATRGRRRAARAALWRGC